MKQSAHFIVPAGGIIPVYILLVLITSSMRIVVRVPRRYRYTGIVLRRGCTVVYCTTTQL